MPGSERLSQTKEKKKGEMIVTTLYVFMFDLRIQISPFVYIYKLNQAFWICSQSRKKREQKEARVEVTKIRDFSHAVCVGWFSWTVAFLSTL